MKTLVFDTETTGLVDFKRPYNVDVQPCLLQIAAVLVEKGKRERWGTIDLIVDPGIPVPKEAFDVHGIDEEIATRYGVQPIVAVSMFNNLIKRADRIAGHNIDFDLIVLRSEYARAGKDPGILVDKKRPRICTMKTATPVMKLPGRFKGSYKWPTLAEAREYFVGGDDVSDRYHDAMFDVDATIAVLAELEARDVELVGGSE